MTCKMCGNGLCVDFIFKRRHHGKVIKNTLRFAIQDNCFRFQTSNNDSLLLKVSDCNSEVKNMVSF